MTRVNHMMGKLARLVLLFWVLLPLLTALQQQEDNKPGPFYDVDELMHDLLKRQPPGLAPEQKHNIEMHKIKCYSFTQAAGFCSKFFVSHHEDDKYDENTIHSNEDIDFDELVDYLGQSDDQKVGDNSLSALVDTWRVGLETMEERFQYLQQNGHFTDCAILVGNENNTKLFRAHKLVLASASPVLEAVLKTTSALKKRRIRLSNVKPDVFKNILQFVYTGETCVESFDKACDLLHSAARLQLAELAQYARAYLWANLYPSNMWTGYQCAEMVGDIELQNTALQMTQWKTREAIKDPSFTDIPRSTLISFLKKNEMSITSELHLYEASLRWAKAEARRRGLGKDPESMKIALGPALGLIRFLTLSPKEFTDSQISTNLLNHTETLAILYNFNSPGSARLPDNLSAIKKPRVENGTKYFDVLATEQEFTHCKHRYIPFLIKKNSYDVFSHFDFSIKGKFVLHNIQIPSQLMSRAKTDNTKSNNNVENEYEYIDDYNDSEFYEEAITVNVIWNNTLLYSVPYKTEVQYNSLLTIPFTETYNFNYYSYSAESNKYKFKFIFHKSGRYPKKFMRPKPTDIQTKQVNGKQIVIWHPTGDSFLYSMSYYY